jgi:DNA-binding NarL/FixJ family response regulator
LRAGAAGYVTKASGMAVLLQAIQRVAAGGRYIDQALVQNVVFDNDTQLQPLHDTLSARERQVLDLIVGGLRLGDIADRLHVSAKTVSTHKMRLMQKLRVENNADLVRYAIDHLASTQAASGRQTRPL